jgi:outer membrane protein assembly factor BamB
MLLVFHAHELSIATAQGPSSTFREAVSVDVETQVVKRLETAREHIVEGQWETAASILQELIDSSGDTLILIEPGRYSNTADYCHLLISQFPDIGLTAYRDRVDAQAKEWLAAGQQTLDETPLLRIVDSAFNSSVGDDALWLLGELAFEQGRFALARHYWSLLVPSVAPSLNPAKSAVVDDRSVTVPLPSYLAHPDPSAAREEVLSRLVLCSIFEGDNARAESELAVCRAEFGNVQGTLAGRTGLLVEILAEVLQGSSRWAEDERFAPAKTVPGGSLSRSGQPGPVPRTEQLIWRQSIPRNRFQGPPSRTSLSADDAPRFFPIVDQGAVFVCGTDSVFAFELSTGRPKWALDENDDGTIYSNVLERPITPHLPSAGMAWYSLCLSEGRLYARMGPPVMRRSRNEGNSFSEIVGLDVAQREGELAFHVTSDVLDTEAQSPEATSWSFEGSPLVSDGRVYVSARKGFPEDETLVACFDASSSRLLWKRKVCASLKVASDRFNLIGQNLLTLGDGRLFLATGTGAVAALDATTGRILWVITYQSTGIDTPHELSDPRRHGLVPCVYHRGIVYAAPDDSNLVYALDAATGQPVWRQQYPDQILHIVGVVDGRLILSGQSVWAVDAGTGAAAWPQRIGFADPAGRGYGRPALTHDFLYWPTRDEVLRIDHRQGSVVDRIRLREDFQQSGGNLVIADGKLLIAQPDGIVVLGAADSSRETVTQPVRPPNSLPGSASLGRSLSNIMLTSASILPSTDQTRVTIDRAGDLRPALTVSSVVLASFEHAAFQQEKGNAAQRPLLQVTSQATTPRTNSPDLWPARRVWRTTLQSGSSVWFPAQTSRTQTTGAVVTNASVLQLINAGDGAECWSVSISEPFSEVAVAGNVLAFAGSSGIVARDLHDGRLVWRRVSDDEGSGEVHIRTTEGGDRFLAITDSHVVSLRPESGDELWRWPPAAKTAARPAAARFPAASTFGRARLLFRPAGSPDYGLLDLADGRLIRRGSLPFAAASLLELPAAGAASRIVIAGVDSGHQVRATQLAELGIQWSHQVSAITHGEPEILTNGSVVVVVDDRQFATRVDSETGAHLWRRPLSATPLDRVSQRTKMVSEKLFVTAERVVRSFSLDDGAMNWERYLGPGEWALEHSGGRLICLRSSPSQNGEVSDPFSSTIAVLDAATGRTIQRLRFDSPVDPDDVDIQADCFIVRAGDELVGFSHWPTISSVDVAR